MSPEESVAKAIGLKESFFDSDSEYAKLADSARSASEKASTLNTRKSHNDAYEKHDKVIGHLMDRIVEKYGPGASSIAHSLMFHSKMQAHHETHGITAKS